mmetsp:Transcript_47138/g.135813  ORF Transcript_47138/g.135813 Transcript_47138/m.135813 type:complete len:255 (+) Transcript_47138:329-1093(+)
MRTGTLESPERVEICHFDGKSNKLQTLTMNIRAAQKFLENYDDFLGACDLHCDAICDDGNRCTVNYDTTCEGGCLRDPEPVNCDEYPDDKCTVFDGCNPDEGCIYKPKCDDGNPCTVDSCDAETGACTYEAIVCDDGVDCTIDSCDSDTGECINEPVDSNCDDSDACTIDSCDATSGCKNEFKCDDGNACTLDLCDESTGFECFHRAFECVDFVDCTADKCDPDVGCIFEPDDSLCDADQICDVNDGCKDNAPV